MDNHETEEAVAAAPTAPTATAKPKRPERERKKKVRFELLHSMTVDQRRQYLLDEEAHAITKGENMRRAVESDSDVQRIAIDLGFDAIMNEKEIRSLAKQMKFSYGAVKQMEKPFQLHFLNCSAALKESLERFSAEKWLVHWHNSNNSDRDNSSSEDGSAHHHVTEIAAPESIVYLSPDSPNVLTTLDTTKTYVIGGIVDKSRKKGVTLNAASSVGITTARLPIQEFITERLDHILNVNTVIEVLIRFQETGGDWAKALRIALPQDRSNLLSRMFIAEAKPSWTQSATETGQVANEEEKEAQEDLRSELKSSISSSSNIEALSSPTEAQQSSAGSQVVETEVDSMIAKLQV